MKIYLVGGAVRDKLLGLPVKDRDWVVVGSTPEEMINAGYQQVGKNFPVFIHPKSHEEYALARTERKFGSGHLGFFCYTNRNITLNQDLKRRDLTINALAQNNKGEIIDSYCGQKDLKNRILRHISIEFSEDPLRILRVARFAARYYHLGFSIANETMKLMKNMVKSGDLEQISPDRIWKETKNALSTNNPQIYFQVLRECGALKVIFPEIDSLFGVSLSRKWNKNIDIGAHTMMSINILATLSSDIDVQFATLCHNLGKNLIFDNFLNYDDFNYVNTNLIEKLCKRLHIPNETCNLAKIAAKFHEFIYNFSIIKPENIVKLFDGIDAWRKPQRIEQIALISEASMRSYFKSKNDYYLQGKLLREAWKIVNNISVKNIIKFNFKGKEIKNRLIDDRIRALENWKNKLILNRINL